MTLDQDSIIRKIKALLELAKGKGTTEEEAASAAAHAAKLLDKYNLDLDLVNSVDQQTVVEKGWREAHAFNWEIKLALGVAKLFRVGYYQKPVCHKGTRHLRVFFYRLAQNVEVALTAMSYLRSATWELKNGAVRTGRIEDKQRIPYLNGVADDVMHRCMNNINLIEKIATNDTKAVVLLQNQLIKNYGEKIGLTVGKQLKQKITDPYFLGRQDGKQIDVNGSRTSRMITGAK